jgi:hypothetical protein
MATVVLNYTTHSGDIDGSQQYKPSVVPAVLADFTVKEDTAKKCILTNLTSPIGFPETIEYQFQEIADVYTGTGIDRALWSPSKRGVAAFCKVQEVWSVEPAADENFTAYAVPITGTVRLKVPANAVITSEMLESFFQRLLAALHPLTDTSSEAPTAVLPHMIRGALNPKKD